MEIHKEMTHDEIITAVNEWQECGFVHPMLCGGGGGSKHRPLFPFQLGDRIQLRCPDCDYVQTFVPIPVLEAWQTGAISKMKEMIKEALES